MKSLQIFFGLLLAASAVTAQQYTISTIAGIPYQRGYYGDTGPATNGVLDYPFRITVDSKGNYYFADYYTYVIRDVSAGTINTIAGNATFGFQGDGDQGLVAEIGYVDGLAIDSSGNLYIADTFNGRIRILNPKGVINTFAGNGTYGYSGDGALATNAQLGQPSGVAVDSGGNVYIADYGNYTVRKVDTKGNITTFAGTGVYGFSGDGGPANKAMLAAPYAVAVDPAGNVYISDLGNTDIREVTPDGNIRTVVSNISTDSIAVDAAGSIYCSDSVTSTIRKVLSNGTQFVIAGMPNNPGFSGDGGPGTSAQLNQPHGVALDSSGNVYVADSQDQVIRLLTPVPASVTVVNGASGIGGAIAPGEIVTIYGSGLGPSTLVAAKPGSNGNFGAQLAGTTVSFAGTNAPVLYTSATQVAAIVPYSMPIGGAADVTVTYQGQSFTAPAVPITGSIPGIFTADSSGTGQAAAVNQSGSMNGPASPAPVGSIISFFVTGEGQTNPPGVDGKPASAPLPTPILPVAVSMAGQNAPVTYAGGAPGQVAGIMQVNAQIPSNLLQNFTGPIAIPVVIQVGFTFSQMNVTITVSR